MCGCRSGCGVKEAQPQALLFGALYTSRFCSSFLQKVTVSLGFSTVGATVVGSTDF